MHKTKPVPDKQDYDNENMIFNKWWKWNFIMLGFPVLMPLFSEGSSQIDSYGPESSLQLHLYIEFKCNETSSNLSSTCFFYYSTFNMNTVHVCSLAGHNNVPVCYCASYIFLFPHFISSFLCHLIIFTLVPTLWCFTKFTVTFPLYLIINLFNWVTF